MGVLASLPAVFTLAEAMDSGVRKDQVYAMVASGEIERVGRGVYARTAEIDPALLALAAATAIRPSATLCLTSALVYHGLTDDIPFGSDIALPRGVRPPAGFEHVSWRSFDSDSFGIGRESCEIAEGVTGSVYSAERTIVDCFRLMHREGSEQAYEALRRWLRRRGSSPSDLWDVASAFSVTKRRLGQAMEALL
ncbi:MAG: type IV toxin-antitoxin system AbiEi family antitoxin domain-containing protein [Aeromicrobium sp.]|uniref:type IV toxin-antitoxin system AbiEi family antitoxin domain-containing protein n=1 Tax=Aeromicrobium sp. TaxID=1871063 RepID=UPI0039E6F6F9